MKGKAILKLGGCAGLLIAAAQAFQTADSYPSVPAGAALERLTKEVHDLKVEVLQLRIEAEQARLETLERESRKSEEDLREIVAEERSLREEVEDLQRQLLDTTLSPEQRTAIAATTTEALTSGAARLIEARVAVERSGSTIRARVEQTYQIRSQLLARAAAIGNTPVIQTVR